MRVIRSMQPRAPELNGLVARTVAVAAVLALSFVACGPAPFIPAPTTAPVQLPSAGKLLFADGNDLWTSAPGGDRRARVTHDGDQGFYLGGKWSPDGSRIAAERGLPTEDGPQLFTVDPATGASTRISPAKTWLDGFAWSPDGGKIVYSSLTGGGTLASGGTLAPEAGTVYVYDVASATQRQVGAGVHPSWSPDGTRIAYVHAAGAIAISAPDGSDMKWLATLGDLNNRFAAFTSNGWRFLSAPAWSRDSKLIAFSAIEGGPILDALQVVFIGPPLPGAPLRPYSLGRTGAQHHIVNLQWSPVVDVLAYASIYAGPHHHIIGTIDPQQSETRPLFDSAHHFLDYTWSPDGTVLLLAIDEEHAYAVVGIAHPDNDPRRLTPGGSRPDWCCKQAN